MDTGIKLDSLARLAENDCGIRKKLLASKNEEDPVDAFCKTARGSGIELYPMELISAGEEMYAAMKRSTNGGGENSPMLEGEDDLYEMFMKELEGMD